MVIFYWFGVFFLDEFYFFRDLFEKIIFNFEDMRENEIQDLFLPENTNYNMFDDILEKFNFNENFDFYKWSIVKIVINYMHYIKQGLI